MTTQNPQGPPTGLTDTQKSAKAIIQQTLDQWGLGTLGDFAWNLFLSGAPESQIFLEIRNSSEYKARFPAMSELSAQGRAINETAYIEYERNHAALMHSYGLPEGFYDQPDDFTKFLVNGVALPELKERLDQYQTLTYQVPQDVRDQLEQFYGIGDGGVLAAMIDVDRALPILNKQAAASIVGATATRTRFGGLSRQQAEYLVELGVDENQAVEGFGNLANQAQALQGLPGWDRSPISTDEALAAQFGGDAEQKRRLEQRQLELLAQNKAGGGVATTQQGAVGAGVAR